MEAVDQIIVAAAVGLLWGITNPFLEHGAKTVNKETEKDKTSKANILIRSLSFLWNLVSNYQFLIPYLMNQLGSVLFYYALGNAGTFLPNQ